ncbi:hypothetical protein BV25DRAFT_759448 [Artomyces pyxidatus]|uniref:Uncharacterized protein n=1 Tax=Artomyces pyxidatus TaxID=48021 RepID=A0ACB8SZ59_9AGAM|nr:hypothetical protein BV25DRAFT_759448 [Artomyces pyxidatus]
MTRDSGTDPAAEFWSSALLTRTSILDEDSDTNARSNAQIQELLFTERTALAQTLLSLDAQINAHSPAARLLPEILAHIFSYCSENDLAMKRNHKRGWIGAAQACRRWRHVALDYSGLWRHIILPSSREWMEEMFSRSKTRPLVISWIPASNSWQRGPGDKDLALTDLIRVEELHLGHYDGTVESLHSVLQSPAPLLRVAEIILLGATCPPVLFDGSAPRLQRLWMRRCSGFPWTSPIFSNIVFLRVDQQGAHTPPPSISQVFGALSTMRALQTLALIDCLPQFPPGFDITDSFVLAYTSLKAVALSGPVLDCTGVLRHIRIPNSGIQLTLGCTTSGAANDFDVIFPLLTFVHGTSKSRLISFEFKSQSRSLSFKADKSSPVADYPRLSLSLEWGEISPTLWTVVDLIRELCRTLSVERLEDLTMTVADEHSRPPFLGSTWLEILGSAKKLQHAKVSHSAVPSFCQALAHKFKNQDGLWYDQLNEGAEAEADGFFFLPHMTFLSLYNVDCAHFFEEEELDLEEYLPMVLGARNAGGAPWVWMDMTACPRAMAEALREVTTSLEVYEESDDEDDSEDDGSTDMNQHIEIDEDIFDDDIWDLYSMM